MAAVAPGRGDCQRAGGLPLGGSRCGLPQSALDGGAPGRSASSLVVALAASPVWRRGAPSFELRCSGHSSAPGRYECCCYRLGTSKGHGSASGMSHPPPALLLSARRSGLHAKICAYNVERTTIFGRTARARPKEPMQPAHTFLTALARVARWAGVYVRGRDAIGATVGFTILPGTAYISRCAPLISH